MRRVIRVGVSSALEWIEDGRRRRLESLVYAEGQAGLDERLAAFDHEVVELGAGLAADQEDVFKAGGSEEGDAGALAFKQGVGGDGRAVGQFQVGSSGSRGGPTHRDGAAMNGAQCFNAGEDGARGIVGRGADFMDLDALRPQC